MRAVRHLLWIVPLGLLLAASWAGVWVWPELAPRSWNGRAWTEFARMGPTIVSSLLTSLGIALCSAGLALLVSLPAARALARRPRPWLEAALLLPALVPPLAYVWGLQGLLGGVGLTDTPLGVILALAAVTFPYVLRALLEGYRLLPAELLFVAENLGASPRRTYWKVELPLLQPSLVVGVTLAFLAAWSDWYVGFLVGGGVVGTYTLVLYPFLLSSDRAVGSLGVLAFLAVPLLLGLVLEGWVGPATRRLGLARGRGGFHV